MHEILVNRLGGLSLPRKSVVKLTDRPDMTLDVYHGRKTTTQHNNNTIKGEPIPVGEVILQFFLDNFMPLFRLRIFQMQLQLSVGTRMRCSCSWKILLANTVDLEQTPHDVASDLGLHCLPPGKNGLIISLNSDMYFY